MLKTLGLDDDLDPVEVAIALEKTFEIKCSDEEAKLILKVGDLFDLLSKKVQADEANRKCASAMAFYRIRRALNDLRPDIGRSPSSDLSPLQSIYTKAFVKTLEERSGLRLPRPAFSLAGMIGTTIIVTGVFGAFILITLALIFMLVSLPGAFSSVASAKPLIAISSILFFGGLAVGFALMGVDPGCLPPNCRTLGALASKTTALSYGRLFRQGADARGSRIWKAMVETLSDFANVPADQITRDTYFLRSAFKGSKAAV